MPPAGSRRAHAVHSLFAVARSTAPVRKEASGESAAIEAIWQVVASIPRGRVSTYGAVALAAGLPGRARLAGRALREAPGDLNLPWHRVLGAGGRIALPEGSGAYREQARRLRAEGVAVRNGRVDRAVILELEAS